MQEHISALQRQVAELISDVVRKDSEIHWLVNTVRDQAHITDNLHDHEKTSTTDILEEKDSVRKNAETQTTNTNTSATQHTAGAHAHTQTETKLSQQESGVQTEKDHQCNIGTQTLERINVDSTNRENRSTLERLSHELAEAKGQIKQMAESQENTFEYARSLLRTAQQNHKDMIDDLKGDHKRKEDEFRKEIDRMRSEYEAKIRNKEVLLMNHVTHHRNKPEAPGSREPEAPRSREPEAPRSGEAQASRSRELEIQPSKEPEAQPSREPEAQPRESPPAPELLGEESDPFWDALVHYMPDYSCKKQYVPSNPNEIRWECAEHVECDKKIRIVKDGAQMKISVSGQDTGEPRDLERLRLPPHIEQYILNAASRGENASHVLAHATHKYPAFEERLTQSRVQNLISSFRTRRDGIPRVANLFELDSAFADYRITPATLESVKDNRSLPSKIVHLGTNFESSSFVCALSSTGHDGPNSTLECSFSLLDMLVSLKWFLDSCSDGFPLYMDAQQKVIRGKPKLVWMGSSRTRYDNRRKKYTHSFVPFLWAIVPEESAAVYSFMLEKLDELVQALSSDEKTLSDVINLCVHDAHLGAISACEEKLPEIRNARCFYHFSKNIRDNKKKLGPAFDQVEKCIFPLHISSTDELFRLLADALIHEAHAESEEAGVYLESTLDTDRFGYPNIAITAKGLRGNQVLNNIVESMNSIMSKALDGESFDVMIFVREAILIMESIRKSSPQCFVRRPTPVIMREYHPEMRQLGTSMFNREEFKEVTDLVSDRIDLGEDTRCFLFPAHRTGATAATPFTAERISEFLDGTLLGEFQEGAEELGVVDLLKTYYCYHLVTIARPSAQAVVVACTCKENRDWSLCKHTYCAEVCVGSQLKAAPNPNYKAWPSLHQEKRAIRAYIFGDLCSFIRSSKYISDKG
ncbi:hypothetical protein FOL47_002772 [Perkinsus chesapeaki]|uniref:MULE transposase domain-containing protein n=1 Tax=Perkinsus chesapeaki TaxID=330153 RepID=A0A7J6N003_PERCH|nr:hypothetical protein FOL47_002772 [Perkinsus chesapeaki]